MGKFFSKGKKPSKIELAKPQDLRKPEEVEADLDQVSKQIGKLHHQNVCIEAQISQETNRFHNLLIEFSQVKPVESPEVVEENK